MRWDQNAVWSLVVGAEQAGRVPYIGTWLARFILGGKVLGGDTLSRIFAVHVFVLPLLLAALVGLHLQLVLRNGISEPPVRGRPVDPATYRDEYAAMLHREGLPFWPCAVWRDAVFAVVVLMAVVLLAATIGATPLDRPPDPSLIRTEPRPDWYFWWYFALLALLPHALENYVIVLLPLLIGLGLLALPLLSNSGERHPARRPITLAMVVLALSIIGALTFAGWRVNWSPRFDAVPLTAHEIGATSGPVYQGGMLFNSRGCLYCHTIAGHGGFRGPNLTYIGDRLTRNQMTLRILNGAYNMPVYAGMLTSAETNYLLAFLATRSTPGSAVGGRNGSAE
jgi:ubiquinol-cytochrome c reductase cytochrome b subunit